MTQKAALLLHESIYWAHRSYFGEATSVRARRAVGLIMAGVAPVPLRASRLPEKYVTCRSQGEDKVESYGTQFIVSQENDGVIVRFTHLFNHVVMDYASFFLAGLKMEDFYYSAQQAFRKTYIKELDSRYYQDEVYSISIIKSYMQLPKVRIASELGEAGVLLECHPNF